MLCLALFTVGVIGSVYGGPVLYSASIPVHVPVGAAPAPAGAVISFPPLLQTIRSQFHSQDELGQYSYGYSNEHSSKVETKAFNGLTSGGYSYIDANGLVQNVNYISDDENGFRVAASNLPVAPVAAPVVAPAVPAPIAPLVPFPAHLPQAPVPVADTPEVQAAREQHLAAKAEAEKAAAEASKNEEYSTDEPAESTAETPEEGSETETKATEAKDASVSVTSPATPIESVQTPEQQSESSPKTQDTPVSSSAAEAASADVLGTILRAAAAHPPSYLPSVLPGPYAYPSLAYNPYSPFQSQYHTQDDFGQYAYGYAGGPSSKEEIKTLDGVTRGGYNYLDANGVVQNVQYVADPELGFNVVATNLPRPVKPEPTHADYAPNLPQQPVQPEPTAES